MTDERPQRPRQEEDVVPGRSALLWLVGTVAGVALLAVVAWGLLRALSTPPDPAAPVAGTGKAARPEALPTPYDRRPHPAGPDSATRARLESYHWIDRERGLVSVPVEAAMELMVRTGGRLAPGGRGASGEEEGAAETDDPAPEPDTASPERGGPP